MTSPAISRAKLHTEEAVEQHLVDQLVSWQGWRERVFGPDSYDRKTALDPAMIEEFVRATQADAWAALEGQYPGRARETLTAQVESRLKAVGTLEVLRNGITIVPGIRISLCAFRPASGLNPASLRAYEANILTAMRQVRYSLRCENALDVVLFVNGLPIITMELKNTLTGSTYQTAETQYRKDRAPNGEPLLTFRRGALVHFALDQDNVSMTTELNNGKTRFLPFNKGRDGGAGNPDIEGEFRIGYLYGDIGPRKAVLSRESLLAVLHRFVLVDEVQQPNGGVRRTTIWPRWHQMDAVQTLLADARANGAGRNYLFQHSAGSPYTEAGKNGIGEKELPRHFDGADYNVLVVAEKYQTGFDQPKLVAMYVDRKLNGLQAVQTLARLNRIYPGKQRTFILDFRNEIDDIKEAFRPYYNVTFMEEMSDPNQVYSLRDRLIAFGILREDEIERFVTRFLGARQRADERPVLEGIVRQAVERFN